MRINEEENMRQSWRQEWKNVSRPYTNMEFHSNNRYIFPRFQERTPLSSVLQSCVSKTMACMKTLDVGGLVPGARNTCKCRRAKFPGCISTTAALGLEILEKP